MSDNYNALCSICGRPYKLCRTCRDTGMFSWKTVTDSANCFKIYTILHQYNVLHKITVDKAKEQLLDCHVNEQSIETYPEDIKKSILDILLSNTTDKNNKTNTEQKSEITKKKTVVKKSKTNE